VSDETNPAPGDEGAEGAEDAPPADEAREVSLEELSDGLELSTERVHELDVNLGFRFSE
jgi:hypothetical protein